MKQKLSLYQTRVLGVLIEKEITTPDQYPLSINALTNGCNQKSSRDPVLDLDQVTVQNTIDELKALRLIREDSGFGSRVVKIKHRFCNTEFSDLTLTEQELGIICVLFLRGPQSPGELRTRTNRLCQFTDVSQAESVLNDLANRNDPLVKQLPREPGKRECRWVHLFSELTEEQAAAPSVAIAAASASTPSANDYEQRISELEQQVAQLTQQIKRLNEELGIEE